MPGDNIYPDLSNDKFDIQYARLKGLSSDLRASFGVFSGSSGTPNGQPFETPSDNDTGIVRFAVAGEDDNATENRSFDLNGGYSFAITQLGNNQFLVDPPNGLYQLGAVPVPGSDSGLSYTYLEIDDSTRKITLQAAEGIILPGYGVGVHVDTPAYSLGVDAAGNLIEFVGGGGYTNLTQFVAQTPWRIFYSDGNGDVQELALGASGDVLTSNGASSVPSWETPATGGGSVTDFIFTDANGFNGTVTSSTTTPTLELTTTLTQGSVFFAGAAGAIAEDNSNLFYDDSNNILGIGVNSSFGATRLSVVHNTLAGASMVKLSAVSTAAASSLQKLLEINLSGANATSGQTSFSVDVTNFHTGTSSTNIAFRAQAGSGTNNYALYGSVSGSNTAVGVYGESSGSNGRGVWGFANGGASGTGIVAEGQSGSLAFATRVLTTSTNAVINNTNINTIGPSNTVAAGFGESISFFLSSTSVASTLRQSSQIISKWLSANDSTYTGEFIFNCANAGTATDVLVVSGPGYIRLMPITATAASALTPAEGMFVFVSNTDATFTSIGPWCYYNGAWAAL